MASSAQPVNPLDPTALFDSVSEALRQTQATGAPAFRHGVDLTMAIFHAMMINLGFRFLGLGEETDSKLLLCMVVFTWLLPDFFAASMQITASPAPTTDDHLEAARASGPLPSEWNRTGDSYSFRYKHHQSQFTFLVKGVKVASKLIVHGMAIEVRGSLEVVIHRPFPQLMYVYKFRETTGRLTSYT